MTERHLTPMDDNKSILLILSGTANVGLVADRLDHFFWHMGVDTFKCKVPQEINPGEPLKPHHWDAVRFVIREHRIVYPTCAALGTDVVPMVLGCRNTYEFVISVASRNRMESTMVIHSLIQELKDKLHVPDKNIHLELITTFGTLEPEVAVERVHNKGLKGTRMGIFYKGPSDRSDYRNLMGTMGAGDNELELLNFAVK